MMYEPATSNRVSVAGDLASTRIEVKAKKPVLPLLFIMFWLGGWTVGGGFAILSLLSGSGEFGGGQLFMVFWLGGWAVGWVLTASAILWMLFGRETFEMSSQVATKRLVAAFLARKWHFNPQLIRNVRKNPAMQDRERPSPLGFPGKSSGDVAFDYGQRTIFFGTELEPAEADLIVETISHRLGRQARASA